MREFDPFETPSQHAANGIMALGATGFLSAECRDAMEAGDVDTAAQRLEDILTCCKGAVDRFERIRQQLQGDQPLRYKQVTFGGTPPLALVRDVPRVEMAVNEEDDGA